jgi:hypothetical protein
MNPVVSFKEMLSIVAKRLGDVGFRRKGNSFYLRVSSNWGIVNFQKSGKSTSEVILFTVNVGVASGVLLNFFGFPESEAPNIDQCQWRKRLGFFLPNPSDTWWRLDTKTSSTAIGEEIVDILLQLARPEMETYMSDTSLMRLWASGDSPGLTEVDRLRCLSVLLRLEGSVDALNDAKDTLQRMSEGRPFAGAVALHLRRLDDMHHA